MTVWQTVMFALTLVSLAGLAGFGLMLGLWAGVHVAAWVWGPLNIKVNTTTQVVVVQKGRDEIPEPTL